MAVFVTGASLKQLFSFCTEAIKVKTSDAHHNLPSQINSNFSRLDPGAGIPVLYLI